MSGTDLPWMSGFGRSEKAEIYGWQNRSNLNYFTPAANIMVPTMLFFRIAKQQPHTVCGIAYSRIQKLDLDIYNFFKHILGHRAAAGPGGLPPPPKVLGEQR